MFQKILIIPAYEIFPMYYGGSVAQNCFLPKYCENFETHIFLSSRNVLPEYLEEFQEKYPELVIHYINIETQLKQSLVRRIMKRPALILRKLLFPKVAHVKGPNILIANLEPIGKDYCDRLISIFEQHLFDLIQVDMYPNLSLIPILPQNPVRVYVSHESQFLRIQSQIDAWKMHEQKHENYLRDFHATFELSFIDKFDAVIVFSEEEKSRHEPYVNKPLFVSPFSIPDINGSNTSKIPRRLVFLGSENHYPNKEGIEWLMSEVGELLREVGVPIYLVGRWSQQTKEKWEKEYGVTFTGFIDDLHSFMFESILLAPIRYGGGLKTKVMEAMKLGIPVIATSHAAEGLPVENEKHLIITNSSKGFIDAIYQIMEDESLRIMLTKNSMKLMDEEFSIENLSKLRMNVLKKIDEGIS